MKEKIFEGVGTAIITPFCGGRIDYIAFGKLIDRQIDAGVEAIIVLGTTGEPSVLDDIEREQIIKFCKKRINGKAKMIVGAGANSTSKAIHFYKQAERLGADGALIVTPYYNKCTQNGLVEHYKMISSCGNLPIIVYNVPGRTGVNILPETFAKLCEIRNVCGVKEASGNISQILEYFRLCGDKVAIYSGEDALNAIFMSLGGSGVISVASNIIPKSIKKVCDLVKVNQNKMYELQAKLLPFIYDLFLEVNPIPVKAGLAYLGLCKNELRLPLTPMSQDKFEILKKEINNVVKIKRISEKKKNNNLIVTKKEKSYINDKKNKDDFCK